MLFGKFGHRCWGSVQACHIKTRGSGGGDNQVFPGCILAHGEQEGKTAQFEAKYNLNLRRIAACLMEQYTKETGEILPDVTES